MFKSKIKLKIKLKLNQDMMDLYDAIISCNCCRATLASSIFEVFVTCFKFSDPPINRPLRHLTSPNDITDLVSIILMSTQ